jgi:hypothetical protein
MNVEIGAEAAQFPEKEYINGIAVHWSTQTLLGSIVRLKASILSLHGSRVNLHGSIVRLQASILSLHSSRSEPTWLRSGSAQFLNLNVGRLECRSVSGLTKIIHGTALACVFLFTIAKWIQQLTASNAPTIVASAAAS